MSQDLDTVINTMSDGSLDSDGDDVDFEPKTVDSSSSADSSVCHTDEENVQNELTHGDTVQVKCVEDDDLCSVKIIRISEEKVTKWEDISYGMKSVSNEKDTLVAFSKQGDHWVELDYKQEVDLIKDHWTKNTGKKTLGSVFFQRVSQLRKKPSSSTKDHLRIITVFDKRKSIESSGEDIVLVASDRTIAFAKSEAEAASKERERKKTEKNKKKSAEIVVDSPQLTKNEADAAGTKPVIKIKEEASSTPTVKGSVGASNDKKRKRPGASQEEATLSQKSVEANPSILSTPSICQRPDEVSVGDERSVCSKKIVLSIEYSDMQSARVDLERLSQVL